MYHIRNRLGQNITLQSEFLIYINKYVNRNPLVHIFISRVNLYVWIYDCVNACAAIYVHASVCICVCVCISVLCMCLLFVRTSV